MKDKPIIVLDFDGVIHSYKSGWKGARNIPDDAVPGALEFIVKAQEHYKIAILSSRSHHIGGRLAMKRWLKIQFDSLSTQLEYNEWWNRVILDYQEDTIEPWHISMWYCRDKILKDIMWPLFKPPAFLTIDDRAITFEGLFPAIDGIKYFQPWYKKASENVPTQSTE